MTDTIDYRGRTLTITKSPFKNQYGLPLGNGPGNTTEKTQYRYAETCKGLIKRFKFHVDADELIVPELDALFRRWATTALELKSRTTDTTAVWQVGNMMKMSKETMRPCSLLVENELAGLRAKSAPGDEQKRIA
jgi:hypothetical protein